CVRLDLIVPAFITVEETPGEAFRLKFFRKKTRHFRGRQVNRVQSPAFTQLGRRGNGGTPRLKFTSARFWAGPVGRDSRLRWRGSQSSRRLPPRGNGPARRRRWRQSPFPRGQKNCWSASSKRSRMNGRLA